MTNLELEHFEHFEPIRIVVRGIPKPEPRPRSRGNGRGVYVPDTADDWKCRIRAAAIDAGYPRGELLAGSLSAHVRFIMPRPKGHFRSGRYSHEIKPRYLYATPISKPDGDNLLKAAIDAFGPWAPQKYPASIPEAVRGSLSRWERLPLLWHDDCQIIDWRATEVYCGASRETGAVIIVSRPPPELRYASLLGLDLLR